MLNPAIMPLAATYAALQDAQEAAGQTPRDTDDGRDDEEQPDDGAPGDPRPEIPWATIRDFRYRANMAPHNAKTVHFQGPVGRFRATLIKGSLDGEAGWGFFALSSPTAMALSKIRSKWRVFVPRGGNDLHLTSPKEIVHLRFDRQIPRGLSLVLRMVFEKKQYKRDKVLTGVVFPEAERSPT